MTNKEFLTKVSRLQREFNKLYDESGLIAIRGDYAQVTAETFNELEKEKGLLQHISKKLDGSRWDYTAMTQDGVKVIAVDNVKDKR